MIYSPIEEKIANRCVILTFIKLIGNKIVTKCVIYYTIIYSSIVNNLNSTFLFLKSLLMLSTGFYEFLLI